MRELMDAYNDPSVREIVGVFAAQVGKTEAINNILGYAIHRRPGPIMVVQPTVEMGEAWAKDRFQPMVRDTPELRSRVSGAEGREPGTTIRYKQFPGGHLTVSGANSPASLASRPIRDLLCDEVDRYPWKLGREGATLNIVDARTRSFWNSKRVYISSPTVTGSSLIEPKWKASDQREFEVPCHACGGYQTLEWSRVEWDRNEETGEHHPETARYVCRHCGERWNDHQKNQAVAQYRCVARAPFRGVAGFTASALYAPWKSCRFEQLVRDFLAAQGDPETLQSFVNLTLAQWWDDREQESSDAGSLASRRESWCEVRPGGTLPDGVVAVTIFADVQGSPARIEYEVVGWGIGEESWSLCYDRIYGDVRSDAMVLEALDRVFLGHYMTAGGWEIYPVACGIDAGYATQSVYDFAIPRLRRATPNGSTQFVYATIGRSTFGRPVWTQPQVARDRRKRALFIIGTDAAKTQVIGRLSIAEPGPGYSHFPADRGIGWFEGLLSERRVTERKRGRVSYVWEKKSKQLANEPLDCRVGAYAVLVGAQQMGFDLSAEAARMGAKSSHRVVSPAPAQVPVPTPAQGRTQRRFVNPYTGRSTPWLSR